MRPDTDLERFTEAQARTYDNVLRELQAGRKTSHWMWFVFPQLRGLGRSEMAHRYGLAGAVEARSYLAHPVLGARLRECVDLVLAIEGRSIHVIFGSPDDLKFHSSMTLFAAVAADDPRFSKALDKYYGSVPDRLTVELLSADRGR
jgi:uncharacterized protein (DUF1810 family)